MNETPPCTWLGGARAGSLWLCYAGPLAVIQKSGISGSLQRPQPIPREQMGKLEEEENEEEKPATKRRREYTDLSEREMNKSPAMPLALALAITDEAWWEAEM